jgi:mannose-6-phosphate isomerase-like protein (cupin superfamily)
MSAVPHELARRIVTGTPDGGKDTVVSDGPTAPWVLRPTGTLVMDIWRLDSLPVDEADDATFGGEVVLAPPAHGVSVRVTIFPPDSSISADAAAAYAASMEQIYGPQSSEGPTIPGMHRTDTLDVMTVIDGELVMIMEDGSETVLRSGDSVVQRGTRHAWSNRSDRPTKVVTTMMPLVRP